MTYNVEEQARLEDAFKKSLPVMPPLKQKTQRIAVHYEFSFTQSVLLIVSFTLYYLFTGLAMLFGRKIPAGYKLPNKKVLQQAMLSVQELAPMKKRMEPKVVSYDDMPPAIDLMKN